MDEPTSLSAVHTTSTTIRVYWSPPTTGVAPTSVPPTGVAPTGYNITYFAGVEDTTGTEVSVDGGSTNSSEIASLNATVTYRVRIVSLAGTISSGKVGPVLAARGDI